MKKITPFFTAILAFLLGAFWYSSYCLGTLWQKSMGHEISEEGILGIMALSFALMNVMAYGLRWLMAQAKVAGSYGAGFVFGLMVALLFVTPALGIVYAYSGKEALLTLWAIDAGYQTVFLTVMSAILAVW